MNLSTSLTIKTIMISFFYIILFSFLIFFLIKGLVSNRKGQKKQLENHPNRKSKTDPLLYKVKYNETDCIKILKSKNINDNRIYNLEKLDDCDTYLIRFQNNYMETNSNVLTKYKMTFQENSEYTLITLEFITTTCGSENSVFERLGSGGLKYVYWVDEFMIKKLGAKCI